MSLNFNFDKPKTLTQWIIFAAATAIILSSPYGTRKFLKDLRKYLQESTLKKKAIDARNLSQALYRLKKRKIISIERHNDKVIIKLTEKGRKKQLAYALENIAIKTPPNWDKKWRLVFFDIPERCGKARRNFVRKLKQVGFLQFQKSVWLYPYDCQEEIDFIAEILGVAQYFTLLTASIENDQPLRQHFNL
jgi:DNA-binding transcriptional regulator PaaX